MNRRYVVAGRVQGVGFRWWICEIARELGLAGWVRNRSDGTVEIRAGGDAASMARLEVELERGPTFSTVERVEKADSPADTALDKPFTIR